MARRLNQKSAYDMGQVPPNSFDSEYQNQDPFYASRNTALPQLYGSHEPRTSFPGMAAAAAVKYGWPWSS